MKHPSHFHGILFPFLLCLSRTPLDLERVVLREMKEDHLYKSLMMTYSLFISSFTRITSITWLETKGKSERSQVMCRSHHEWNKGNKRWDWEWITEKETLLLLDCDLLLSDCSSRVKRDKKRQSRENLKQLAIKSHSVKVITTRTNCATAASRSQSQTRDVTRVTTKRKEEEEASEDEGSQIKRCWWDIRHHRIIRVKSEQRRIRMAPFLTASLLIMRKLKRDYSSFGKELPFIMTRNSEAWCLACCCFFSHLLPKT